MSKPTPLRQIAAMIDHALLHPTLTDADLKLGCDLCREHKVAAACVKPCHLPLAREHLMGSGVALCTVIAFPHGCSSTRTKAFETADAIMAGAVEIDMVANPGKVLAGDWAYVANDIRAVRTICQQHPVLLKVIFETDYLPDAAIVRLAEICTEINVDFVKTSTGFGFVKQPDGTMATRGATEAHLKLMRAHAGAAVSLKASGGIRTLADLLRARSLGASRIGTSSTVAILEEALRLGLDNEAAAFPDSAETALGKGGY